MHCFVKGAVVVLFSCGELLCVAIFNVTVFHQIVHGIISARNCETGLSFVGTVNLPLCLSGQDRVYFCLFPLT